MAEKEQQNTQKTNVKRFLLWGVVLILVLGAAFWYLSRPPATETGRISTTAIPDLNFSILDSETFSFFKVWEALPIVVGETGKENPFSGQ